MNDPEIRTPSLIQALIPIAVLITLLVLNVIYFGDHTLDGANQFVDLFGKDVHLHGNVGKGVIGERLRAALHFDVDPNHPEPHPYPGNRLTVG